MTKPAIAVLVEQMIERHLKLGTLTEEQAQAMLRLMRETATPCRAETP